MPPDRRQSDTNLGILKETFLNADNSKNRDAMLYDMLNNIDQKVVVVKKDIDGLQKRKKADTAISAGMGFFGGAAAVFAKMAFWRS